MSMIFMFSFKQMFPLDEVILNSFFRIIITFILQFQELGV